MDHSAGLDISVKETSICIVDDTGRIVREVKVASEPEALLQVLKNPAYHFKRIGLEAGPLSQWLFSALAGHSRHCNILSAIGVTADMLKQPRWRYLASGAEHVEPARQSISLHGVLQ